MTNALNRNLAGSVNCSETCGHHYECWQGLHAAACRLQQCPKNARLRHAFDGWYAIEWMLDGTQCQY